MKNMLWSLVLMLFAAGICPAQSVLYLPQFVDGKTDANGVAWGTYIFVTNPAALGTSAASVTITLTKDNGTPMNIPLTDVTGASGGNTFQISGGQTKVLGSPSNGQPLTPLNIGFATVTSNLPVNAGLIFIEYGPGGGNPISEAWVPAATPLTRQAILALRLSNPPPGTYGLDTGVAVANAGTGTATITFQLLDSNGTVIGSVTRTLAANNHTALFISELFPNAPSQVFGTMRITSDNPIVTIALSFSGAGLFATLPVNPLP